MKKNISTLAIAATALFSLSGCQKDDPFRFNAGEGVLNCESLTIDYINRDNSSRATGVNIAEFDINFINTNSGETVRTYKYHRMPQVVSLPKGDYRVEASYGDNPIAEWESPYYLGNSTFTIRPNEITEDVEPVTCKLSNIRVSVNIDDMGLGLVEDDAKVIVSAGTGSKEFVKSETRSAYFRYVDGSRSITATFSGTINGSFIEGVSRVYDDGNAGNHYAINFAVTSPGNAEPGDIEINGQIIRIDSTVSIVDWNWEADPDEEDPEPVVDNMRPVDGSEEPTPVEPAEPVPPVITPHGFTLGVPYEVGEGSTCVFDVKSVAEGGITEFTVDIVSDKLTPEELAGVGLAAHLDLVNPGALAEPLAGLGFPVNVGGKTEVEFSITKFIPMLMALGSGEHHEFHIKVSDAIGTTSEIVHLVTK